MDYVCVSLKKTLKKKWKQIERVYEEFEEVGDNITTKECKEIVHNFIFSPPGVEETMQLTPREYKDNIAVMVQVV